MDSPTPSAFHCLLRKLQLDPLSLPQMTQLKYQHAYLEKLRQQRSKIEELKEKHERGEQELRREREQGERERKAAIELQVRVQLLLEKVAELEKRNHLAQRAAKVSENEAEKLRVKMIQMGAEVEQLKQVGREKDRLILQLEEELERLRQKLKDIDRSERKRMKTATTSHNHIQTERELTRQIMELQEIASRQHQALQKESECYDTAIREIELQKQEIERLNHEMEGCLAAKRQAEEKAEQLVQIKEKMMAEMDLHRKETTGKTQICELRRMLGELAREEVDKMSEIIEHFP